MIKFSVVFMQMQKLGHVIDTLLRCYGDGKETNLYMLCHCCVLGSKSSLLGEYILYSRICPRNIVVTIFSRELLFHKILKIIQSYSITILHLIKDRLKIINFISMLS